MLVLLYLLLISSLSSALLDQLTNSGDPDHSILMELVTQEQALRMNLETQVHQLQGTVQNLQNTLNNLTGSIKNTPQIVAFEGKLSASRDATQTGHVVVFDTLLTNIGHAYSTSTGVFHCPVNGLYLFSLTMLIDGSKGAAQFVLHQNTRIIARPYAGPAPHWVGTSETAIVQANAGDEIYVKAASEGTGMVYDHFSRFSGVLLQTM